MTPSAEQQHEELILIGAILGTIAAMIATLVWWQRRKEARLAGQETIELSIDSVLRSVLVFVPAICVVPVAVGLFAHFTDPWARGHALAAVLTSVIGGLLSLPVAAFATARFRSVGSLRLSPGELQLAFAGEPPVSISTARPFQLNERWTEDSEGGPLQVVEMTDGRARIGFMYRVGLQGKAAGPMGPGGWPAFGREGRLLHERLKARLAAVAGAR